jgi:hypothetical protein
MVDKHHNINLLNPLVAPPFPWCAPEPPRRKKPMPQPKRDRIEQLKKTLHS